MEKINICSGIKDFESAIVFILHQKGIPSIKNFDNFFTVYLQRPKSASCVYQRGLDGVDILDWLVIFVARDRQWISPTVWGKLPDLYP